jgi:hypothetical protein
MSSFARPAIPQRRHSPGALPLRSSIASASATIRAGSQSTIVFVPCITVAGCYVLAQCQAGHTANSECRTCQHSSSRGRFGKRRREHDLELNLVPQHFRGVQHFNAEQSPLPVEISVYAVHHGLGLCRSLPRKTKPDMQQNFFLLPHYSTLRSPAPPSGARRWHTPCTPPGRGAAAVPGSPAPI